MPRAVSAAFADPRVLATMSGLEIMRAMRDGTLPGPPIATTIPFELDEVEEGRVVFTGIPQRVHCNPMGGLHGGWYGTLLDSAMACAVMTKVPKGHVYTTLEYKINITRALPVGTPIRAIGTVAHAGRSTGIAWGEIRDAADGRLYATGSTTCLIMALGG